MDEWEVFFQKNRGKILGMVIGGGFGFLAIAFGFWKALFLAICLGLGYFIGKRLDEDQDFSRVWEKIFKER
ncbi:DUF2273 domain-containing protein [Carboxydothermus ferrireducens]|uniref:Membrane protein n=1 Tax=Carboxydothermus ferrireducens DSM 11255 TaxID=1119529 RepID=A0ABX2RFP8_9THEO|nr:DUF2273 domain-containing protein [Carboxydothermus ferrireducens]NYE58707.1 putative membrane protein [Carboxydothermus ferrireducens DSM 11255]